jgi:AAA15 family ATPase/GTPase
MIKTIKIKNFKSIKDLQLDCKKVNVFIGEPNVGKSNVLEALGFFSWINFSQFGFLNNFIRFESISNLFYDESINDPIEISLDSNLLKLEFKNNGFSGKAFSKLENDRWKAAFNGDYNNLESPNGSFQKNNIVKTYIFGNLKSFPAQDSAFLLPPHGENLVSFLMTHRNIRESINSIFNPYKLRLILKPQENKIEVRKQLEDIDISYPYSTVSDTLQRMVFYECAILSNNDSVLVFEEPEAHAFPFYTKQLAELIALDNDNQYFISTHNPYFLGPVIEKSKKEAVSINIVYYEDYQTKLKQLSSEEIEEIMEIDVFSNLDRYLKP